MISLSFLAIVKYAGRIGCPTVAKTGRSWDRGRFARMGLNPDHWTGYLEVFAGVTRAPRPARL